MIAQQLIQQKNARHHRRHLCGATSNVVGQHIQHHAPENFITSAGFGTMGFGLPAAIGAKKARPQDEVILVNGDGSIKRGKAPIKIVLLDNQRLSMGASSNLCFSMPATATPF